MTAAVVYISTKQHADCALCEHPLGPRADDGQPHFCDYDHAVAWHKIYRPKAVQKSIRDNPRRRKR